MVKRFGGQNALSRTTNLSLHDRETACPVNKWQREKRTVQQKQDFNSGQVNINALVRST